MTPDRLLSQDEINRIELLPEHALWLARVRGMCYNPECLDAVESGFLFESNCRTQNRLLRLDNKANKIGCGTLRSGR